MPELLLKLIKRVEPAALEHPNYTTGYEYAKARSVIYNELNVDELQIIIRYDLKLFIIEENHTALGMASYLMELVEAKEKEEAETA